MSKDKIIKWLDEKTQNPLDESNALFEAALSEFSSHSFKDSSLNDILKAAGLNKGSFYYRFYDKMDMYLSLLYRMGMEKMELFKSYDNANKAAPQSFFDELYQKADLGLQFAKKELRYNMLWRRVLVEEAAIKEAISNHFGDIYHGAMREMVDKAKHCGEIKADLPTDTIVVLISTILERIDLLIPSDAEDEEILQSLNALLKVLKHGLA